MARSSKQQLKAATTARVIYPKEGAIEVLRGVKFDVPVSVVNKRAWIESRWREEQAKLEAETERDLRNQQVLNDRSAEVRKQEAEALLLAREVDGELSTLKRELADIQSTVAAPDQQKITEASQTAAALMGRVVDCSRDVNALADKVEALHVQAVELADQAQKDRELTLKLLQNQQELINGGNKHHGELINSYATRYVEAEERGIRLSEEIGKNWEIVQNAVNIDERAIQTAQAACRELVDKQLEEFRLFLSLMLMSVGVTERDIEEQLLRMEQGFQRDQFVLGQDFLNQSVKIARSYMQARQKAEDDTNKAAAANPNIYQFGPNPNAGKRPGFK